MLVLISKKSGRFNNVLGEEVMGLRVHLGPHYPVFMHSRNRRHVLSLFTTRLSDSRLGENSDTIVLSMSKHLVSLEISFSRVTLIDRADFLTAR